MNKEQLLGKGVKSHFTGQETVFSVDSLKEHFEGVKFHDVDVLEIEIPNPFSEGEEPTSETVQFLKEGDIDFSEAIPKEVITDVIEEEDEKLDSLGLTFEEAKEKMKTGHLIALPEWKGFWFGNIKTGDVLVFTEKGEILDTPDKKFTERNDWKLVEATPEQKKSLDEYWATNHKEQEPLDTDSKKESAADAIEEKEVKESKTEAKKSKDSEKDLTEKKK